MEIFGLFNLIRGDGYYEQFEEIIEAYPDEMSAQSGLEQKKQEMIQDRQRYINLNYEGGATYPKVLGGPEGAAKSIADAGKGLFIRPIKFIGGNND